MSLQPIFAYLGFSRRDHCHVHLLCARVDGSLMPVVSNHDNLARDYVGEDWEYLLETWRYCVVDRGHDAIYNADLFSGNDVQTTKEGIQLTYATPQGLGCEYLRVTPKRPEDMHVTSSQCYVLNAVRFENDMIVVELRRYNAQVITIHTLRIRQEVPVPYV